MLIHREKLRWLFWLRWKLFTRGFTRDRARIIGTIFMALFLLPVIALVAVGTYFAYRYLPAPFNAEILFIVLTGVYLLWIVLPIFEFNLNEGLDVSKLVLFPLTRVELMLSLLFSTLLDIPMLGLLLVFVAVLVGWAVSVPVFLLTLVGIVIFYAQVVGMSQLVLALLMRTLQSRRFRDLSIILIVVFSSTCGILGQLVGRISTFVDFKHAPTFYPSLYLQWLPPGMTARAIQQATLGNWGASLLWLAFSLLATGAVLYLWQLVLERSLTASETGGSVRTRRQKARVETTRTVPTATPTRTQTGTLSRIFSSQVLAIAGKELRYFWRDPQLKAILFQSLVSGGILAVWPLIGFSGRSGFSGLGQWFIFVAPGAVFLSLLSLSMNTLGMERQGLTTLFLFPVAPQRILWGKNLAVFAIGASELIVVVGLSAVLLHALNVLLPVLAVGFAGLAVVLGTGNISSVLLPFRMREMQRGFRATGSSSQNMGCLRAFMSIGMFLVSLVVLIPVALALLVPMYFNAQWIWAFSLPAALLYSIAFHQVVSRLVAPRMLERTPEILAVTTRE